MTWLPFPDWSPQYPTGLPVVVTGVVPPEDWNRFSFVAELNHSPSSPEPKSSSGDHGDPPIAPISDGIMPSRYPPR